MSQENYRPISLMNIATKIQQKLANWIQPEEWILPGNESGLQLSHQGNGYLGVNNNKELNSANKLNEIGCGFFPKVPRWELGMADILIPAFENLTKELQHTVSVE